MPRIWLGNFDFESTLAGEIPSREAQRIAAELVFAFLPVANEGDVIVTASDFDDAFLRELQREMALPAISFRRLHDIPEHRDGWELVPWGWTSALRDLARQRGWQINAPDPCSVAAVHAREFSVRVAEELQVQHIGVHCIHAVAELDAIVSRLNDDAHWVVKSQWTTSGRGQLRRRGRRLSDGDRAWITRHLHRDGLVVWEPWLNSLAEFGFQWSIPATGVPELLAIVPLLTDQHGQYIGSVLPTTVDRACETEWRDAVDIGRLVCERMQAAGYFGPVGIDAMRYADTSGAQCMRPIQEINARWTMGRLAVGWRRYLRGNVEAMWMVHSDAVRAAGASFSHHLPTSPSMIDGQPAQRRMQLHWT